MSMPNKTGAPLNYISHTHAHTHARYNYNWLHTKRR